MTTTKQVADSISEADWQDGVYHLTIKGDPVAKGRPRVVNGHTYTPEKTRDAELTIGWEFIAAHPGIPVDSTSEFRVHVGFSVSPYKNGKPRKADLDNLFKTVLDALNGIVWADDNQVTEMLAVKWVGEGSTQITIYKTCPQDYERLVVELR